MILRYVNMNEETVMAKVKLSPENPHDAEQTYLVRMEPTREPKFVTVAGPSGNLPTPFILNPGTWTASIATNKSLHLDYFALLPAAYYEGTILQERVLKPCLFTEQQQGSCRQFTYASLANYDTIRGDSAYTLVDDNTGTAEFVTDARVIMKYFTKMHSTISFSYFPVEWRRCCFERQSTGNPHGCSSSPTRPLCSCIGLRYFRSRQANLHRSRRTDIERAPSTRRRNFVRLHSANKLSPSYNWQRRQNRKLWTGIGWSQCHYPKCFDQRRSGCGYRFRCGNSLVRLVARLRSAKISLHPTRRQMCRWKLPRCFRFNSRRVWERNHPTGHKQPAGRDLRRKCWSCFPG